MPVLIKEQMPMLLVMLFDRIRSLAVHNLEYMRVEAFFSVNEAFKGEVPYRAARRGASALCLWKKVTRTIYTATLLGLQIAISWLP